MADYKIDDQKIKYIATELSTKSETVIKISELYNKISEGIKPQYLAHVVRSIEVVVRKQLNCHKFQIRVIPVDDKDSRIGFGSAKFFPNLLYNIYYPESLDDKQKRVIIAHELGHLFVEVCMKGENPSVGVSEPLSSIFGILTILDKDDFYENHAKEYLHKDYREIVNDFILLRNESNGIYNES